MLQHIEVVTPLLSRFHTLFPMLPAMKGGVPFPKLKHPREGAPGVFDSALKGLISMVG